MTNINKDMLNGNGYNKYIFKLTIRFNYYYMYGKTVFLNVL